MLLFCIICHTEELLQDLLLYTDRRQLTSTIQFLDMFPYNYDVLVLVVSMSLVSPLKLQQAYPTGLRSLLELHLLKSLSNDNLS